MKLFNSLSVSLAVLFFASCEKPQSMDVTENGTKLIQSMDMTCYKNGNKDYITKYTYQYDENDRLVRYDMKNDEYSAEVVFSYNNNEVTVEMEWNDQYYGPGENILKCSYEDDRLVRIDMVPARTVYHYTYDNGYVSTTNSSYGTNYSAGESYEWENGDLIRQTSYEGGPNGSYDNKFEYYDVEDKSNLYLWEGFAYEPLSFTGFVDKSVFPGLFGRKLLKTYSSYENTPFASVYTFKYEFDDEGYVIEYTIHQDGELYMKAVLNY